MSDVKKKEKKIHLLTGCRGQNRLVSRNKIQLLTWCESHNKQRMWKNIQILSGWESYSKCVRYKKKTNKKQRDIPGGNWLGVRAKIVEWCGRLCKYWLDQRAITGV